MIEKMKWMKTLGGYNKRKVFSPTINGLSIAMLMLQLFIFGFS